MARATVTVPRRQPAAAWEVDRCSAALWPEFAEHSRTACLAGAYCLALAQLSALGRPGELTPAVRLATDLVGDWAPRRSGFDFIDAFDGYRSVSHLWAAIVYGRLQGRAETSTPTIQTVPDFLACAVEIARLSADLDWAVPAEGGCPSKGALAAAALTAASL